jgi:diaminopimelate decarboxylase
VDVVSLGERYGTPLYITDEGRIREKCREFLSAFRRLYPEVEVKYAYKANSTLAVLHILRQEGLGADVVSGGELSLARHVGVPPEEILFTGNSKTDAELELAVSERVLINLDALHELDRLERICRERGAVAKVSFRINPAVSPETHPHLATGLRESKFGIPAEEALQAYRSASEREGIEIAGIHMHIGSQITTPSPYLEAAEKLMDLVGALEGEGIGLRFVDLGGGIGIPYRRGEPAMTPSDLAEVLIPLLREKIREHRLPEPTLFFEPGRYLVGDASLLLTRVTTLKETPFRKFVGVDAGFQTLLRPILYGAYHETLLANKADRPPGERVTIVGNICESGDLLAEDRDLPPVEEGDWVALLDVGAYGISMASQYNSRPRPAEVLVSQGRGELIRERETLEDLLRHQIVPDRLRS